MFIIHDTTLRDGEQAPFVSFNTKEKLEIAKLLFECGANELEIGIPSMGIREQEDIREILNLQLPIRQMGWNKAIVSDVESSLKCNLKAIDLSIPTSKLLIDIKYNGNIELLLSNLANSINLAKKEGLFVCIGAEDASRADIDFLIEVMKLSHSLGADRFRFCDTVGILTPLRTFNIISKLSSLNLLPIEMHTHNDFGMACANGIIGLEAGAKSINTTVIGLGERAGNAPFEQVLMSLICQFGEDRKFKSDLIKKLVFTLSKASKVKPAINAPIIGKRLFSHESGVHASGMMKGESSYEPFSPKDVGSKRFFPIGKHSGSATIIYHLKNQGIEASKDEASDILPIVRECVTRNKKCLKEKELKDIFIKNLI